MNQAKKLQRVAEIQGLYGPLQVLENQIQQIWACQHLQPGDWRTDNGSLLKVIEAGSWNRGRGPDFREAIIELNGERRIGDIEIHLYREDWWRHGHDRDPGYNDVILHVLLFAGGMNRKIRTQRGTCVEEWNMGPYVREDIESISGGEPGLFGEHVPEIREWMESEAPFDIRMRLMTGCDRRWLEKTSMARCLTSMLGPEAALHRMTLYYLGFPFNRRCFYEMADRYPPSQWRSDGFIELLKAEWGNKVKWGSGRPANRAERRLRQYIQLAVNAGDWMDRLLRPPEKLISLLRRQLPRSWADQSTPEFRRYAKLAGWRSWLCSTTLQGQLNNGLVQRLWVDAYLPVMIAAGILADEEGIGIWFHSHPGNFPAAYRDLLRMVSIQSCKNLPICNGWIQGLLWLEDQLRLERVRCAMGPPRGQSDRSRA